MNNREIFRLITEHFEARRIREEENRRESINIMLCMNRLNNAQSTRPNRPTRPNIGEPQRQDILTEEEFNNFPILTIISANSQYINETCLYCSKNYEIGDNLTILPCNHILHKICIKEDLLENSIRPECPMCRINVRTTIS